MTDRRLLVLAWALLVCSVSSGAVVWFFEPDIQGTPGYALIAISFAAGVAAAVLGFVSARRTIRAGGCAEDRWASILVTVGGLLASLPWVAYALYIAYLIVFQKLD
jgi:peptidoglycan/LPS O-acetylase OafA/YrhL